MDDEQVYAAIRKAHAAGDSASVQRLTQYLQEAPAPPEGGFDPVAMAKNVPGSAWQFAKDITAPIHSPIDTATGLWKVLSGTVQKVIPGTQDNEKYADAVGQALVERYGSVDAALRTLQNDPVGAASDVAGLLTGGGMLAAKVGVKGAGLATKAGQMVDPLAAVGKVAGAVTPKGLPQTLYSSASKFSTALPTPERAALVRTALDEQLMPTSKGVRKLTETKEALGADIGRMIDEANASGRTVSVDQLRALIPALKRKMGGPTIHAASDLRAIDSVVNKFMEHMQKRGQTTMTPRELQNFKTDAYDRIDFNRAKLKANLPKDEARRAMAGAARREIEGIIPGVAEPNRRWGQMQELLPHLERSAARIENRDILGIGVPIKTGAGAAVGDIPGAIAGAATGLLDAPRPKAQLALTLERIRRGQGPTPGQVLTRSVATQAGRMQEDEDYGTYLYGP